MSPLCESQMSSFFIFVLRIHSVKILKFYNMKKKSIVLSITCALTYFQSVYAQINTYSARIDVGYGFPSGAQYFTNVDNATQTIVPYSLGAGFRVAAAGNYMFSDHFGGGLDLSFLAGTPAMNVVSPPNSESKTTIAVGSLFAMTPNFILSANNDVFNPYMRFGLVVGIPSFTISTTETGPGAQNGTNIDLYSGNLALGLYSALGIQFRMTDQLMLNLELFDRDLTYSPLFYTNERAFDGNSKNSQQILVKSTANRYFGAPTLTQVVPFGCIGLNGGLTWKFGV